MWILERTDQPADDGPLTFRLSPGAVKTIGRAPRADFIVDMATVSRLHCRLTAEGDHLEVFDLDSTNGTFVNDQRVTKGSVAPGDRLRVGRVEFGVKRG
ncbi:MAG: FHA domain-containing protein [Acidobacteriota bacterium]|nr:FHA domain-containing protein [Acidobacteriota bacterium]